MPKAATIDGRSVDEYVPRHLRDMFYKNPYPDYTYATTNGYAPYDFSTKGLLLYLPLWALKGSPFKSVDAYGHTCTVIGALWTPQGRTFDHSDDDIDTGDPIDVLNDYTLEAWIKRANTDDEYLTIMSNIDGANGYIFDIWGAVGADLDKLGFNSGGDWFYSTGTIADTNWHHAVVSLSATNVYTFYLDKAADGTGAGTITSSSSVNCFIGQQGAGDINVYRGTIGEVRIYNRVLSAAGVAHNYNCTAWRYR